jgi:hypothetical protein
MFEQSGAVDADSVHAIVERIPFFHPMIDSKLEADAVLAGVGELAMYPNVLIVFQAQIRNLITWPFSNPEFIVGYIADIAQSWTELHTRRASRDRVPFLRHATSFRKCHGQLMIFKGLNTLMKKKVFRTADSRRIDQLGRRPRAGWGS